MTAVNVPLFVEQGASKRFQLLWGSGTSEADLQAFDLIGCTARMMIKKGYPDSTPMLSVTTEDGGITLQPDDKLGVIDVHLSDEKTDVLEGTSGVWDIEVEWPSGDVDRVAQGTVTISPSVTR